MKDILKLIRPQQWLKNLFVFIPVFFGGALFNIQDLWSSAITAVSFCLAASSIYCFNDIQDAEDDRRHPVKCHRPIASGAISVRHAYEIALLSAPDGYCHSFLLVHESGILCETKTICNH